MSYEDWDREQQEFFDDLPVVPYLDSDEKEYAQEIFELGFLTHGEDVSAAARDEWWEFTGMEPQDFDWEAWRELMDYGSD